jgi:regulatory protein
MGTITGLSRKKGQRKIVDLFLEGKLTCSVLAEVVKEEGLQVGQELSAERLQALAASDGYQRCLNSANRFLGYRPRSEAELKRKLYRYDRDCIEKVLSNLKEKGLVNDDAFARFWKENREAFSPRSRRLTGLELRRKGVDGETIDRVVGEVDDNETAYRAALGRVRRLSISDYQGFRRRLGEYLKRRGFNYEVIKNTTDKIWKELGSSPG